VLESGLDLEPASRHGPCVRGDGRSFGLHRVRVSRLLRAHTRRDEQQRDRMVPSHRDAGSVPQRTP